MEKQNLDRLEIIRKSIMQADDLAEKLVITSTYQEEKQPPGYYRDMHIHNSLELRMLFGVDAHGKADYSNIQEIRLSAGGRAHCSLSLKENERHITLRLDKEEIYLVIGLFDITIINPRNINELPGFDYLELLAAVEAAAEKGCDDIEYTRVLLAALLTLLINQHRNTGLIRKSSPAELIAAYIKTNYFRKELSIREIAEAMNISPGYIQTVFRNRWGTTPIQYLNELRLNSARKLLQQHNLSVSEISLMCGWRYPHYFSRKYQERFGCLPTEEKRKRSSSAGEDAEK